MCEVRRGKKDKFDDDDDDDHARSQSAVTDGFWRQDRASYESENTANRKCSCSIFANVNIFRCSVVHPYTVYVRDPLFTRTGRIRHNLLW